MPSVRATAKLHRLRTPSEPATYVQRLPKVFQTSMAFRTLWVVVVQMSLVHWAVAIHVV